MNNLDSMDSLQTYLSQHFFTITQLAHVLAISEAQCEQAMAAGLFPAPSYVVADGYLHSVVFGKFAVPNLAPNAYVHRDMLAWMKHALDLRLKHEMSVVKRLLEQEFKHDFGQALLQLHQHSWPMPDAFRADGNVNLAGLELRCHRAWEYFCNGTFGVCVAHPTSAKAIAEKEVLQEKLMCIVDHNDATTLLPEVKQSTLKMIRQYEAICMPFTRLEYPRSSRKKLADFVHAIDC